MKRAFVEYVRGGGGVMLIHAANNAFADWPEFNDMIGLGWRKGGFGTCLTIDPATGQAVECCQDDASGHGSKHPFVVTHARAGASRAARVAGRMDAREGRALPPHARPGEERDDPRERILRSKSSAAPACTSRCCMRRHLAKAACSLARWAISGSATRSSTACNASAFRRSSRAAQSMSRRGRSRSDVPANFPTKEKSLRSRCRTALPWTVAGQPSAPSQTGSARLESEESRQRIRHAHAGGGAGDVCAAGGICRRAGRRGAADRRSRCWRCGMGMARCMSPRCAATCRTKKARARRR